MKICLRMVTTDGEKDRPKGATRTGSGSGERCSPEGSGPEDQDSAGEEEDGEPVVDDGDIHDPFIREGDVTPKISGQIESERDSPVALGHTQKSTSMRRYGSSLQSRSGHFEEHTEQSTLGRNTQAKIRTPAGPVEQIQLQQVNHFRTHGTHHHLQPGNQTSPSALVGGSSQLMDQGSPMSSTASSASSSSYEESRADQYSPSSSASTPFPSSDDDTPDNQTQRNGHKDKGNQSEQYNNNANNINNENMNRNDDSREEPVCLKKKLFTIR